LTVEARDLACARGGRLVFSGVSFLVGAGALLAVTGPNGAGKSSLLRILAGLLRPQSGSLTFAPREEEPLIHYLGHADSLKAGLTLRENLAFWATLCAGRAPCSDVAKAATICGIAHALDLPAGVLSAGQRRRGGLARLILSPRPLWLLDEPGAGLDAEGEALIGRLLENHLGAGGLAVAATHQPLPVAPDSVLRLGPE